MSKQTNSPDKSLPNPTLQGRPLPPCLQPSVDARAADLNWRVVERRDDLRALAAAWDDLCGPSAQTLAPAWALAWFDTLGRDAQPYVLVAEDEGQQFCAVLPLACMPNGSVELAGARCGGIHGDVALRAGSQLPTKRGLRKLFATGPLRRMRLRRLAVGGNLHQLLSQGTLPGFGRPRLSAAAPAIVGFDTWEAFLAHLSKRRRHELRRHLRRFAEVSGARVRWVAHAEEIEPALDTLFDLHAKRFASMKRPTSFRGAELRAFHLLHAQKLLEQDRLLLGVLEADGRPIAVAYGWHRHGGATLFQMGIDPEAHTLSPGIVLAAHVLRDQVIGAGRDTLDLGEGCYPWKVAWANEVRHLVDVTAYGPGPWGRARRRWAAATAELRSMASARLRGRVCHGHVSSSPSPARCSGAGCPHAPID